MLDNISFQNLKSFADLPSLDIKPITILCGTNSSGKSTILQSLLLFKQSLESQSNDQVALLNGKLVHFGNFKNIIFTSDTKRAITITHLYSISRTEFRLLRTSRHARLPLGIILRDLLPENTPVTDVSRYKITFSVTLRAVDADTAKNMPSKTIIESLRFSLSLAQEGSQFIDGPTVILKHTGTNNYDMSWQHMHIRGYGDQPSVQGKMSCQVIFANLMPLSIRNNEEIKGGRGPGFEILFFSRIRDLLRHLATNYSYIGPLREEPARRYIYEDEVLEIGVKGENAAFVYLKEKGNRIMGHYVLDPSQETFVRTQGMSLEEGVKRWFETFGIDDFQTETQNELIQLTHKARCKVPTRVNIADSGFGISQIFPIIVEGLRMEEGKALVLEQPEIHLHPKMQMQLADYFISLGLSGKRLVVETHSDHIINRLIRRIIEDKTAKLNEMIGIYFVQPEQDGAKVETIRISPSLGIVNWPQDFFDQTASEQERIMRARLAATTPS
jgi:predicted ATPase